MFDGVPVVYVPEFSSQFGGWEIAGPLSREGPAPARAGGVKVYTWTPEIDAPLSQ